MDDEEPPLPPQPMCLMAKHSKVSDSDSSGSSSSDDDLSPLALKGLLDEYTSMIKKQKSKLKALEDTHEKLKLSNDDTSRDVVINDIALTSLKTPEWSQLVFCDVFVTILVWSLW
jgi:hypothetical protein